MWCVRRGFNDDYAVPHPLTNYSMSVSAYHPG
ncbi:hypothetical protein An08g09060 [Aspergillus niger]|uniref:Uncharacterized protein n=2 Tax=Aspergillus niger TaxID=5061 RepID=A5AB51_ASPNC|nr:hypothetical protein An08g09060 [Aspergillus niger]CAK96685.1 hypothetical protein An08g09060 [Aspergillus niger]